MNTTFRLRRKAIKIQVDDEEDDDVAANVKFSSSETSSTLLSNLTQPDPKLQKRKISGNLEAGIDISENSKETSINHGNFEFINDDKIPEHKTVFKKKERKKKNMTKLSFGLGDNEFEETTYNSSKNKLQSTKNFKDGIIQASKFRKGLSLQSLPGHFAEANKERPTYNKDYLNELKNSTPATRSYSLSETQNLIGEEDEINTTDLLETLIPYPQSSAAIIPTEAEIREKKERRSRLAREADFISFDEDVNDCRILLPQSVNNQSRLVRDDEDFAEGFDEFVEDERIALGKKQERQARRQKRKEIAEMIQQAEGSTDAESDDSEAERCAAYENAQTRAGMDGLQRNDIEEESIEERMPTNITPLPILSECLKRFHNTLDSMEVELERQKNMLLEAEQEERDIITRESEVQALLAQAGERLEAMSPGLHDIAKESTSNFKNI
ncbi:hypothetical protein HI914_00318 [Erysiphe necator]|nr:hypothetical protein HI914_00318 [Erysiphe necator]